MGLKFAVSVMVFVIALTIATVLASASDVTVAGAVLVSVAIGWMASSINGGIQDTIDLHSKKL